MSCSVVRGGISQEDGSGAARLLLAEDSLPTAVIAYNDQMAMGFIRALQRRGINVPEEISVVGFDTATRQASLLLR